jgi:hypothetical protein
VSFWLTAILLLCAAPNLTAGDDHMPLTISEVKAQHADALMALPGVVSVGIGKDANGHPAIIVGLDKTRPATESQIPDRLESYPVVIEVVGTIKAR